MEQSAVAESPPAALVHKLNRKASRIRLGDGKVEAAAKIALVEVEEYLPVHLRLLLLYEGQAYQEQQQEATGLGGLYQ